jgi:hypothetical protein
MSSPRPIRPGDLAVIHSPLCRVETVDDQTVEIVADGLLATVPVEWVAVVHDRRGGES